MGSLHYGSPPASFDLDDRTLAHVELVVLAKLRRNESFALTLDDGHRRSLDDLDQRFVDSALRVRAIGVADINREWLEELIDSANTTAGMKIASRARQARSRQEGRRAGPDEKASAA